MKIEDIRMPNSHVLILPDDGYDKIKIGDTELELDTSYEPEMHAQTSGIVIKPCEKLVFGYDNKRSTAFDSDIEVQEGDRVWFHYLAVKNAMDHGETVIIDGKTYCAIPYDLLYARKRDEKIIGLNGWFMVSPFDEPLPKTNLVLPDTMKGNRSKKRGRVVVIATPLRGYRGSRLIGPDRGDIKVGDVVYFRKIDAVPLQYEYHSNLIKGVFVYRMQEKDILCVE